MKKIGYLSFGYWSGAPGSAHRDAAEMLHGHVELAQAAERAGLDGAWIRVHHYEQNITSPFPLLTAMAAATSTVELGTGVINMRYENPLYMAELAGTADLLSGGRLQLGVSRGSPEPSADGPASFGYPLPSDKTPAEDAAERIALFRRAIAGEGMAAPAEQPYGQTPRLVDGKLAITPQSPGLSKRIWYGAGGLESAQKVGELGMNLMSSTLVFGGEGEPLGEVQARQIEAFRESWRAAGHEGEPRVSVSRSIMPIVDDLTQAYYSGVAAQDAMGANRDQVGIIDNQRATFGKTYVGEPDKIVAELLQDDGVMAADTLLVTIPSQLGTELNERTFEALAQHIRPALGD